MNVYQNRETGTSVEVRLLKAPSIKLVGLLLFIFGLICLIGVSASLPFVLATIGFTTGVIFAVLGLGLGLVAMFPVQTNITNSKSSNFNITTTAENMQRLQEATIKMIDATQQPPLEIATALISGEGESHRITINSQGQSQTVVTADLTAEQPIVVGNSTLRLEPQDSGTQRRYTFFSNDERAKVFLNSSNKMEETLLTIHSGEINTGVNNNIKGLSAYVASGSIDLGIENTVDGTNAFWVKAGHLNLGINNKMINAGITVELGQVNAGDQNKFTGLRLLNKSGQCNLGERNTTNNYHFTNTGNNTLGSGNNINCGNRSSGSIINIGSRNNGNGNGSNICINSQNCVSNSGIMIGRRNKGSVANSGFMLGGCRIL